MKNKEVADKLYEIADYLEMQEVEWKPRAYRRAARNIEALSESIEDIHERGELEEIDGVGENIAKKIAEYLDTGEMEYYQQLREELPVDIEALTSVESLGPKRVKKLYKALEVTDLDELEQAAEEGKIEEVEDFGKKSQGKILGHIEQAKEGQERMLIGKAFPIAQNLREEMEESEKYNRVTIVGSFRRRRPTVGDIDILATADDAMEAMEDFTSGSDVKEVMVEGETKSSIKVSGGLQVDLRIVDDESYGAALQYFTGSKDHNVTVRTIATRKDWKLNEYGLFDSDENKLAGETEEGIYNKLQMNYIEPELREDTGEVEAAQKENLPDLVEREEVKGDLQMHSKYSDGRDSIEELAEKAEELGHEYILITDHGPSLQIANGLEEDEIDEQREEIKEINEKYDVEVLHGIEANITDEGLDVSKEACGEFDLVVVAMHNPTENPTEDLIWVMEDYPVDIIAHPQNRKINEREPLDLDLDRVVEKASEEDVALEINSQPARLDLDWANVKEYRDKVKYVISTDAHSTSEMELLHLGVSQARRGWCEKENIINTENLEDLLDYFRG
ncbi:DNA polymerase/3'-5' exonuclease PolX [Candidatus Nanohaloarchaea archaeon]|nr:DNA polymerase/3'-5' exonuclease PolX [Candidatus Nanohaloarchaea archaeon]